MGFNGISRDEGRRNDDEVAIFLKKIVRHASILGASDAAIIQPDQITAEDRLAEICGNGRCENYGRSPGCPPHVGGPAGFRELQTKARYALVFRIATPSAALFSDECTAVMRRLHEIAAGIEQAAIRAGYPDSKGFAGGACKKIFCHDQADCPVLLQGGECRYPQQARPSMSGFGINVAELMKTCGWPADIRPHDPKAASEAMSWVAGLVLLA